MKKSRVAAIFAALSLSAGISLVGSGSADAATGDRHFVLISTHGLPRWKASATLYDGQGNEVYSWKQETRSGGRVKWDFTDGGDGGRIEVRVEGFDWHLNWNVDHQKFLKLYGDHCFLVDAGAVPRYTGDSIYIYGGCNAD